jgi:membrane protein YdbS with pleckstrin-like domain
MTISKIKVMRKILEYILIAIYMLVAAVMGFIMSEVLKSPIPMILAILFIIVWLTVHFFGTGNIPK